MRVGVVIITHGNLGQEFVRVIKLILPEAPVFYAISIETLEPVEEMRTKIADAIKVADQGAGVLILTDMFGGTPANISLSLLGEQPIEVVTGVNLPMLIKLATIREERPLGELARFVCDYGQRNISVASELLPGKDD